MLLDRRNLHRIVAGLVSIMVAACGGDVIDTPTDESSAALGVGAGPICPGPAASGDARCHAIAVTDVRGRPHAAAGPQGYGASDLLSAYGLASAAASAGSGRTIALIDAYDYPNAEADLAVYRSTYGLPPCTTANGCFRKVTQSGRTSRYPHANAGWSQEAALDLDMASAICPKCNLLLVEANSSSIADLGASVDTAAKLGAIAISNSYGASEFSFETWYEGHYNHPGIAVTVSSGDGGYGVSFPASSRYVTAVGGTSLVRAPTTARGWAESAWGGAGSGCSKYIPKPKWQTDASCARRSVADVAAVADPSTGVSVYWTQPGQGGWLVFGGTSVSSPIVAAVYALAGNVASIGPSYPYANASSLFDVTDGANGTCGGSYLCSAGTGYDGPTGLGTPNGMGAF
jgi:subtilase family serine protease